VQHKRHEFRPLDGKSVEPVDAWWLRFPSPVAAAGVCLSKEGKGQPRDIKG
jgi:hypothetical protein